MTIECFRCGECCKTLYNGLLVTFQELRMMQKATNPKLEYKLVRHNRYKLSGQTCPLYTGCKCSIYEERPTQCRLYHCGRLSETDRKIETINGIQELMVSNPEYMQYRQLMELEGVTWGNQHGWDWRKRG